MAETSQPNPSMRTELEDVPLTPLGGKRIQTHPQALQNRRLLPIGDLVSRFAIWAIESETNNVGSAVTPSDSRNTQIFKTSLRRTWERVKKFNNSTAGNLEFTHPIRFPAMVELQTMPNTPMRQMAYLLWHTFTVLLGQQGSKMQTFVDANGIDEIEAVIVELEEFIDTELGDGSEAGGGKFQTGAGMPSTGRIGILQPTPLHGNVSVNEPSSEAPSEVPPDATDR